jgi:CHAT domain-containing protein
MRASPIIAARLEVTVSRRLTRARIAVAAIAVIGLTGSWGRVFTASQARLSLTSVTAVAEALVKPLAKQLVAAPSDDARAALLSANPTLKTPALDSAIINAIDEKRTLTPPELQVLHRFLRRLALEIHDADSADFALILIGVDDGKMGNYDAALTEFEAARTEATAAGLPKRVAQVMNDIGVVHRRRGDLDLARDCYAEALRGYEQLGDRRNQASVMMNLAVIDGDTSNYREAIALDERVLVILQAADPRSYEMATVLNNIGVIYDHQHDIARAVDYYQRALALQEVASPEIVASSYINLGSKFQQLGRDAEAEATLNKALALAQRNLDRGHEATALFHLAAIQTAQKHYDAALDLLERSRAIREVFEPASLLESFEKLSELYLTMGRLDEARDCAVKAVTLARNAGSPGPLWGMQNQLGRVELARNDIPAAEHAFRDSIAGVEELRRGIVGGAEQQQQFLADMLEPYHELIGLLVRRQASDDAFAMAERVRARSLVELIQNNAMNITQTMTPDERDRERALRHDVVLLSQQMSGLRASPKPDAARLAALADRLQIARNTQDDFYTHLYGTHPGLRERRGDVPLVSSEDLRDVVTDASMAAVEFQVTDQHVFVFVARKGAGAAPPRLTVHAIDLGRDDLTTRVNDFRTKLAARDLSIKQPARALYDLLLQSSAADLAGATNIVIAPDGPLWDLPFQALVTPNGQYLIEQASLSLVPSFSALRVMQRVAATPRDRSSGAVALVFGSSGAASGPAIATTGSGTLPALAEAEAQARAIGAIYGAARARVVVGANATVARFAVEADQYRIVHVAAHGVLDDSSPLHSYVLLGRAPSDPPDAGRLEAWSVMQMPIHADLVVLSACDTGRGRIGAGEGLIGMSWALFAAGAPSAVVSQWQVDAVSTTTLMTSFHRAINAALLKSGRVGARAASLRQAALEMLRSRAYSHPFYWAPFVVIGDGS